jgi:hypothetical protein
MGKQRSDFGLGSSGHKSYSANYLNKGPDWSLQWSEIDALPRSLLVQTESVVRFKRKGSACQGRNRPVGTSFANFHGAT